MHSCAGCQEEARGKLSGQGVLVEMAILYNSTSVCKEYSCAETPRHQLVSRRSRFVCDCITSRHVHGGVTASKGIKCESMPRLHMHLAFKTAARAVQLREISVANLGDVQHYDMNVTMSGIRTRALRAVPALLSFNVTA